MKKVLLVLMAVAFLVMSCEPETSNEEIEILSIDKDKVDPPGGNG